VGGGEVALEGLSLKEPPPWGDAAGRMGTLATFLLLKDTTPSESSSSERISNTLFPLSRGAGAGDEATTSGTAAMGGGELGVGSVWGLRGGGEDGPSGVSVVVGVGEGEDSGRFGLAAGAEEAPALVARAAFSAVAKTILLEESITDPTFRQTKQQKLRPIQLYKSTKHADKRNIKTLCNEGNRWRRPTEQV